MTCFNQIVSQYITFFDNRAINHSILLHFGETTFQTCQLFAGNLSRRSYFASEGKGAIGTETGYIDGWPPPTPLLGGRVRVVTDRWATSPPPRNAGQDHLPGGPPAGDSPADHVGQFSAGLPSRSRDLARTVTAGGDAPRSRRPSRFLVVARSTGPGVLEGTPAGRRPSPWGRGDSKQGPACPMPDGRIRHLLGVPVARPLLTADRPPYCGDTHLQSPRGRRRRWWGRHPTGGSRPPSCCPALGTVPTGGPVQQRGEFVPQSSLATSESIAFIGSCDSTRHRSNGLRPPPPFSDSFACLS